MTTRRRARRLGPWLLLAFCLPGCATTAPARRRPRPPPCHRRLRRDRRRLAAGHPPYPAREARPRQAAGRALPRHGPERHLLDDRRRTTSRASSRRGATRSSSSTCAAPALSHREGIVGTINARPPRDVHPEIGGGRLDDGRPGEVRRPGDPRLRLPRRPAGTASTGSATASAAC